jgi:hypothetical protein
MTMTPRERLLTAMRCEQPDRVPIQVRGVYPTMPGWLKDHHKSFRPLHDLVAERCDPVHPFALERGWYFIDLDHLDRHVDTHAVDEEWVEDVVTIDTPRGPLTQLFRRSLIGNPGYQLEHAIKDEEDLEKFLSIPAVAPRPDPSGFFETAKRTGERALVIADVGGNPIGMVHTLMGSELLAMWSVTNREGLVRLLKELRSRWEAHVAALLDAGVGPVYGTLGHEVALPPLLAPKDFQEFVVEMDLPVMRMIRDRGHLIHVHCHDKIARVLEGFVTLGINCLHPVEAPSMGDITLVEAKRRLAGKVCIEGNMQIGDLQTRTPDEIRGITRQIVEDAASGGGLILCPTASPFWPTIPPTILENYRAFVETGLKYGRY